MSSRRQFIKDASLVTGGLLLSTSAFANIFSPRKQKVIIIGAGFAGLIAAYKLHLRNIDFVILESRGRVGGRVFSHVMGPDRLVVELGAEWVGNDHDVLIKLCEDLRLPLENNQFNSRAIINGKFYDDLKKIESRNWETTYKQLLDDYNKLVDKSPEKIAIDTKLDNIDWYRYLVDNGCKGMDLQLRDLLDSTDFGESIRQVSAYAAISEYASTSDKSMNQMDQKIKGGNMELAKKLASFFEDKILTRKHVVTIEQTMDDVKVYCADGSTFVGDKLICTAPAFAVTQIDWKPGLPDVVYDGLKSLQYSRINKNAVLFNERIWEDEAFDMITDMPGHYFYHATKFQKGRTGVLTCYTIGDKAQVMANENTEVRNDIIARSLAPRFPCAKQHMIDQTIYYWGDDKYSRGAYAVYGKGQWLKIWPELCKPFMNTLFAGEHLSEFWSGFMEGALETGIAAAEAIVKV